MRAQRPMQQRNIGAAAPQPTRSGSVVSQPCRLHAATKAALSTRQQLQQQQATAQEQPCSTACLRGVQASSPPPVEQQRRERQCVQQPGIGSGLPVLPLVAAHQLWATAHALPAHAAESIPPEALVLFREFLDQIAALGPWGGALFVVTVMCAEMVPLFPTQPLSLASGLLFGPVKGAVLVVVGVTLAAINAFSLSKGVGRTLAEKVIAAETGGEEGGAVAKQLSAVTQAIEAGGFMRQVTAITLLRLTPVVPFSASNYLLGLTPVQLGPLVVGTVAGMSVWSILYASLGGASKALLEGGTDLDVLLTDLGEKAREYSSDVAVLGLAAGLLLGGGYLVTQRLQQPQQPGSSSGSGLQPQELQHLEPPREEVLQGQQK